MEKRTLGRSNITVTAMGMGCWGIGGYFYQPNGQVIGYGDVSLDQGIATVEEAINQGITLFDTADVYGVGQSEKILGEVLPEYRDDVIIATKFGTTFEIENRQITGSNANRDYIHQAIDRSLKRLNTDHIDLYQLHIGGYDPDYAWDVVETLEELVNENKIRYYGWSTDSVNRGEIFAKAKHCTAIQYRYNMIDRNDRMLDLCKSKNLASILKGPMGYGLLTGKYTDDSKLPKTHMWHGTDFTKGKIKQIRDALNIIKEIMVQDGRTLPQAAIGWLFARDDTLIPIPGAKSPKQIKENALSLDIGPLSSTQMSQIEAIISDLKTQVNIDVDQ